MPRLVRILSRAELEMTRPRRKGRVATSRRERDEARLQRRLIRDAIQDPDTGALDGYLLGVIALELEQFTDAAMLLNRAIDGGLTAPFAEKAERLRAICAAQLGE